MPEPFQERASDYTTATGAYRAWSVDVNLDPYPDSNPKPIEDKVILQYYEALQYTLYESNYPETIDRTGNPRQNFNQNDIALTILSSPVECMCFLLEGSRQCPGDMLLVLSLSWVSKVPSDVQEGLYSLYVHKAISFEDRGRSFIDVFHPPRRVTHLVNYFTRSCTDGQRNDGEAIEKGLDCPMSSSIALAQMIDDKLLTRILLAKAGVAYPPTLALAYCPNKKYDVGDLAISIMFLTTEIHEKNKFTEELSNFLKLLKRSKFNKVTSESSAIFPDII